MYDAVIEKRNTHHLFCVRRKNRRICCPPDSVNLAMSII